MMNTILRTTCLRFLALAGLVLALPTWALSPTEVAKLTAADGAANDRFGISVSVAG